MSFSFFMSLVTDQRGAKFNHVSIVSLAKLGKDLYVWCMKMYDFF